MWLGLMFTLELECDDIMHTLTGLWWKAWYCTFACLISSVVRCHEVVCFTALGGSTIAMVRHSTHHNLHSAIFAVADLRYGRPSYSGHKSSKVLQQEVW